MKTRIIMISLGLAVLGYVGQMDYDDARQQHDYQCEMIQAGHWPESVNPNCETEVAE